MEIYYSISNITNITNMDILNDSELQLCLDLGIQFRIKTVSERK
jgi:hypothetical protein